MKNHAFTEFVKQNDSRYRGVAHESPQAILSYEQRLGVSLPESLSWLLSEYGYSFSAGVDSLSDSVESTLRLRVSEGLPHSYVLLNDWNDSGIVLLSTDRGSVVWCESSDLSSVVSGLDAGDVYEDYAEWSKSRFEEEFD
jgi:hypothetical protein